MGGGGEDDAEGGARARRGGDRDVSPRLVDEEPAYREAETAPAPVIRGRLARPGEWPAGGDEWLEEAGRQRPATARVGRGGGEEGGAGGPLPHRRGAF